MPRYRVTISIGVEFDATAETAEVLATIIARAIEHRIPRDTNGAVPVSRDIGEPTRV